MAEWAPHADDEDDEDGVPPWEQRGRVRRDCLPHRGPLLQFLGMLSMGLGLAACCLAVPVLLALPLSILVWQMAKHDVAQMKAGDRDRAGMSQTLQAADWAHLGMLLSLGFWIIPTLIVLAMLG